MKKIKNIADFKRAMEVGAKVHCIYHLAIGGRDEKGMPVYVDEDKGVREVTKKQSNSFALKTEKKDGSIVNSWCNWPKVAECKIQDDKVIILEEDFRVREGQKPLIPVLTYSILEA